MVKVRNCRTLLQFMIKTIAAYLIGKSDTIDQIFTDGTNRRQTSLQALICGFISDNGLHMVTLSSCIIAEEETAESLTQSIIHAFKESGELLQAWCDVTAALFPNQQDLFETIPAPAELTLAKAAKKGMIMTDTCNTACKLCRLLIGQITVTAEENAILSDQIATCEGDCW